MGMDIHKPGCDVPSGRIEQALAYFPEIASRLAEKNRTTSG